MFFMMIQPTHRKSINYNYMKIRNFIYFALAAALLSSCSKASDLGGSSTDPTPPPLFLLFQPLLKGGLTIIVG